MSNQYYNWVSYLIANPDPFPKGQVDSVLQYHLTRIELRQLVINLL